MWSGGSPPRRSCPTEPWPYGTADPRRAGYVQLNLPATREATEVAEVAEAILAGTGVAYTFERRKGAPGQAILTATSAVAAAAGADPVIVVGRSGHTLHNVLGSVPVQLLHHSAYPVLTIP